MATILLVEDDTMIQDVVVLRLELAGHEVLTAENGKTGVEKTLEIQPDMVLMDMHMPIMSGHEAVALLRESDYTGLIVALTASAMVAETNKAMNAGCDSVIIKPISEEFESQVAKFLEDFKTP